MAGPSWFSALPAAAAAAFWLLAPGLLVLRAGGLRGVTAWSLAPLVSTATISTSAVLGTAVAVPWGPWVPLAAALLVAGAVLVFRGFLARRPAGSALHRGWRTAIVTWEPGRRARAALVRLRTPEGLFAKGPDPLTTALPQVWRRAAERERVGSGRAAAAGVLLGCVLTWITVVLGFGTADGLSSTFDAVFHYNAVAHILHTQDASSLTLGALTNPAASTALYPAGWHDLVSLVAMLSGAGVPVATNLTAWAVTALLFPLSALALTRQVAGPSAGAAFVAPVLATGFTAFPWALMSFGVLWPNLLGVALLPAHLAVLAAAVRVADRSTLGTTGAVALFVLTAPALALAHPNAVFSLAVLGVFPLLWGIARLARLRRGTRQVWQPVLAFAALVLLGAAVVYFMTASPLTAGVRGFDWPAFVDTPGAAADVVGGSTNRRPLLLALSLVVLVGLLVALRRVATSWLVPAHLVSGALYVLAASSESGLAAALTGAWYNDSYRLAAMVPVTGVPLAVLGLLFLAGRLRALLLRLPAAAPTVRRFGTPGAVVAALAAVLVSGTGGLYVTTHAWVLSAPYQHPSDRLLDDGQREFLERVGTIVPPDQVVAADPFTGNALLFPLTGREVLFPHMTGNWTPEQTLLATRLRDAGTNPDVCAAARATRVGWVLSGPITFWPSHGGARWYPGLHDLGPVPGFELVDSGGGQELWRLTACDPATPDGADARALPPAAPQGRPPGPGPRS